MATRTAKKSTKTEVARAESGGVPAAIAQQMARDAGQGVSKDAEDNLVPLVYILQALSPQVLKRNENYIDGAEAGMIWLRNSPVPIVDGDEGILFQPCHFHKDWVEWIPRDSGGGFVARHAECPKNAERIEDPKRPGRVKHVMPNGNEIVETRYHAGLVYGVTDQPLPYVIPMSRSGHSVSRGWMFMMNGKSLPNGGGTPPSFSCLYRLKTKVRQNVDGEWFTWLVEDAGWVENVEQYEAGKRIHDAFASGEKMADLPEDAEQVDDVDGEI